ncbi:MAG: PQQ-dependent sugar dehydrogenase [Pirellulales bacterium]|nr:PQQ-dependent sugar dehydrogenase [Pirellulales bacterium]
MYQVDRNSLGQGEASPWIDVNQALLAATGRGLNYQNPVHGGLRAIAFHPEFANLSSPGYGKFYASVMQNRPTNPTNHFYLGDSIHGHNINGDSALIEFTYDFNNQQIATNATRELFRVNMPVYDHPIKQIRFNNHAQPGDEDYGLLYIAHGDASVQSAIAGGGQNTNDALGKMLRINPLQDGGNPYSIPATNPFVGGTGVLPEIYALGFRNPHTFSFNLDDQGNSHIIGADAGRDNIEEINIIRAGRNYGWSEREGTFVHLNSGGYINGVTPLPSNEALLNDFVYPVVQVDHNTGAIQAEPGDGFVGFAIVSGHVLRDPVDANLRGLYFYSNFGESGDIFYAQFSDMLSAVDDLDPGNPSRNEPSELTWAESHLIRLALDNDNNPATPPLLYDNFNAIVEDFRSDTRFGEGPRGEMYISSKRNGTIYLAPGTLPASALTLVVDRTTGEASVVNVSGGVVDIDGLSLRSESGSLAAGGFAAVGPEWSMSAANDSTKVTQLKEDGILTWTGATTVSLGTVFLPQATAFGIPAGEDLQFLYTGPGSAQSLGYVVYAGEPSNHNTIVMTIDRSGGAVLLNESVFAVEVEAYRITSTVNALQTTTWTSLDDQNAGNGSWSESALSGENMLLELQEDGSTLFSQSTPYDLGQVLLPGFVSEGFIFEFLLAGASEFMRGVVKFELGIPGDFDMDGNVDGDDFLIWQRGQTSPPLDAGDLAIWREHFGEGVLLTESASQAPEPAAGLLLLSGVVLAALSQRPVGERRRIRA